jgi:hypothetical protein
MPQYGQYFRFDSNSRSPKKTLPSEVRRLVVGIHRQYELSSHLGLLSNVGSPGTRVQRPNLQVDAVPTVSGICAVNTCLGP